MDCVSLTCEALSLHRVMNLLLVICCTGLRTHSGVQPYGNTASQLQFNVVVNDRPR